MGNLSGKTLWSKMVKAVRDSPRLKWDIFTAIIYILGFVIVDNIVHEILDLIPILISTILGDAFRLQVNVQFYIIVGLVAATYNVLFSLNLDGGFRLRRRLFSPQHRRYRYVLWIRELLNIYLLTGFISFRHWEWGESFEFSCATELYVKFFQCLCRKRSCSGSDMVTSCHTTAVAAKREKMYLWGRLHYWLRPDPVPIPSVGFLIPIVFYTIAGVTRCVVKMFHFASLRKDLRAFVDKEKGKGVDSICQGKCSGHCDCDCRP